MTNTVIIRRKQVLRGF